MHTLKDINGTAKMFNVIMVDEFADTIDVNKNHEELSSPPSFRSSFDDALETEYYGFHLDFWDKLGLMALGTTVVCLTLCIVVCTVGRGCCIYNLISNSYNEYELSF